MKSKSDSESNILKSHHLYIHTNVFQSLLEVVFGIGDEGTLLEGRCVFAKTRMRGGVYMTKTWSLKTVLSHVTFLPDPNHV